MDIFKKIFHTKFHKGFACQCVQTFLAFQICILSKQNKKKHTIHSKTRLKNEVEENKLLRELFEMFWGNDVLDDDPGLVFLALAKIIFFSCVIGGLVYFVVLVKECVQIFSSNETEGKKTCDSLK